MKILFHGGAFLSCVLALGTSAAQVSSLAASAATPPSATTQSSEELHAVIERAMARSGDLDMILKALIDVRPAVSGIVQMRQTSAPVNLDSQLDQILDPQNLRDDVVGQVGAVLDSEDVKRLEEWAARPKMAAINIVLSKMPLVERTGEVGVSTPETTARIVRIIRATQLAQRMSNPAKGVHLLSEELQNAIDPGFVPPPYPFEIPTAEGDESLATFPVGPGLAHIPDSDLDAYLEFAESETGQRYFAAVSGAMAMESGRWRTALLVFMEANFQGAPMAVNIPPNYAEDTVDREVRITAAMERSGDFDMILSIYTGVRPQVEAWIQQLNPGAAAKMAPELDRILAPETLREGVSIRFGSTMMVGGLEQIEAWSSNPQMVAINAVLINPFSAGTAQHASKPEPEFRDKLLRVARATSLAQRLLNPQRGMYALAMDLRRKVDPEFTLGHNPFPSPAPSDEEALVDQLLVPALSTTPVAEIDQFLAFAESEAGVNYFRAVSVAMDMTFARWREPLLAAVEANAKMEPVQQAERSFEELSANAKEAMHRGDTQEAQKLLLRAAQLRPEDSETQTLLGEAATHLRGGMRPSRGQLRLDPEPEYFVEVERYLNRAIELDPTNARAHALLARAKFLQSKDSEAEELLKRAELLDPDLAWLKVNQADLATVLGRHDQAIALYREATERPEGEPGVHYWAMVRSRVAYRDSGRLDEYSTAGRQYIQAHPEDQDYPLFLAEHFLYSGTEDAEALEVLNKTNPRRNWQLRNALFAKAYAGLAHAARERTGMIDPQSRQWIQKAIEHSNGSETDLIDILAMEPQRLDPMSTVVEASSSPRIPASQAMIRAMRAQRVDLVRALARSGIDLDAPMGDYQIQPLAFAVMGEDVEMVKALLELGADPGRARVEGRPLEQWMDGWSHQRDFTEIRGLLKSAQ